MRPAAVLLPLLLAGGCGRQDTVPPDFDPNVNHAAKAQASAPLPVLLRYKPPGQGGPDAFRSAIVYGVLDFSGPCVRLQDASGRMATVVAASGSRLLRDTAGPYWPSRFERLRHGSSVTGGGGEMPRLPADDVLDGPIPDACRSGPAVELVGIKRPPESPPTSVPERGRLASSPRSSAASEGPRRDPRR